MADQISGSNGNHGVVLEMEDTSNTKEEIKSTFFSFPFIQKLIAEVFGTYFLIFAGCGSVAVNLDYDKVVTLLGISIVWGLAVMVLVYSVGHISGAHFNPAVTIAFATCKRFPWKQVPPYILAQVVGSTLANGTLRLLFTREPNHFLGTQPAGSDMQCFVFEFIITFYLMFIISGVATDNRAIGELAGLAVGATVLLNVMFAGPVTGASMNPARSLGPAIVFHHYDKLWIYIVAPTVGAISGAWIYNLIRFTDKSIREITKCGSFLRSSTRNSSS
ncbi:aquaporin NIP1-1-like isoform X1 [Rhodamnia argentea]|uniref:Aquaporin NIP1-1-like isoform X1 n=1 Tax=Rhodamnia argentea TaxID=178133 RepID=A0A8B8QSW5_9MYRT|nr:aquaporin NIP1-1-like isoform X1 [Rhodamnia argentea]